MNDDSERLDFLDYDEAVALVEDMWEHLGAENSDARALVVMEQIRSVTRDHLIGVGCDPSDELQTRAALCGALLSVTIQAQVSPIAVGSVLLARSLVDIESKPGVSHDSWDDIIKALSRREPARPQGLVARVKQWLRQRLSD